ncbi:MAG: hypothetical protein ACLPKB_21670 [Xanthobacteraceae bacterium]
MTRLKKTLYGTVAALAVVAYTETSFAEEGVDFEQFLRGSTIGLTAAAPKPGLYFSDTTVLLPQSKGYGQDSPATTNTFANGVTILWSSGLTFLGGNYAPSVNQAYYQANAFTTMANDGGFPSFVTARNGATLFDEIHNTYIDPINFQWNLGSGLFASAGMGVYLPDGSTYLGSLNPDFLSFQPHAVISYLANGWNLTANANYIINTPSAGKFGVFQFYSGATTGATTTAPLIGSALGTALQGAGYGYLSGQILDVDWTATRTFGKWEFGPVGYFKTQTTLDQPGGGFVCNGPGVAYNGLASNSLQKLASIYGNGLVCGYDRGMGIGALLGYDFGPVAMKLWGTVPVRGVLGDTDQYSGPSLFLRMSFKLWDPEYKEIVTK